MSDKKKEIRGYIPTEQNKIFRAVVTLKDANLSDSLQEAIADWLNKPENKEIIEKHNLKDE